jgi:hypothetical protein
MKNKPDPTVLKTSFLSNESVKRTPKSHETIPWKNYYVSDRHPVDPTLWKSFKALTYVELFNNKC